MVWTITVCVTGHSHARCRSQITWAFQRCCLDSGVGLPRTCGVHLKAAVCVLNLTLSHGTRWRYRTNGLFFFTMDPYRMFRWSMGNTTARRWYQYYQHLIMWSCYFQFVRHSDGSKRGNSEKSGIIQTLSSRKWPDHLPGKVALFVYHSFFLWARWITCL